MGSIVSLTESLVPHVKTRLFDELSLWSLLVFP